MYLYNVIVWRSRAGYETKDEAITAAKLVAVNHDARVDVEDDRAGKLLHSFVRGAEGEAVEVPIGSCGIVVGQHHPCLRAIGCKGPHESPETSDDWIAWARSFWGFEAV